MSDAAGWWAVAETGQGGGLPDTLHGPYWSQEEATAVADTMISEMAALGRRDGFDVVRLVPVDDDD